MSKKFTVGCIIGTRPEVIKMAPIIREFEKYNFINTVVIVTAQHRQLLDDMMRTFKLNSHVDMNIMQDNQSLAELTGNLFLRINELFKSHHFDFILAQGDTTTTLCMAEVAFFNRVLFGHIEAGLRSYDLYHPFPEELNRVFVSKLANYHYAPTQVEFVNLVKENIPAENILITGNTVIDALYLLKDHPVPLSFDIPKNKRIILMTLHRRENFGEPIQSIFKALLQIVKLFPDIIILYPVHPNPNVKLMAEKMLSHEPLIKLLPPLPYDVFVTLFNRAYLVLSDSGGIQEEAPALNKPILVLRNVTERPLIIKLGLGRLVGTNEETIIRELSLILSDKSQYAMMQKNISPYGDGKASERIVNHVISILTKADL